MQTLTDILCRPLLIDHRAVPGLIVKSLEEATYQSSVAVEPEPQQFENEICLYDCNASRMQIDTAIGIDDIDDIDDPDIAPGSVTAVVPLFGVITRHGYSGWFSSRPGTVDIGRYMGRLDRNPAIGNIILAINSPGGEVTGTPELSELIYNMRVEGNTRIVAAVDGLMASAATYVGTACEKVYAIGSSDVGSVGVISTYADWSKYLEKLGVDHHVARIPDKKARFTGIEPMDDDMKKTMAQRNEEIYDQFIADLARNRDVSEATVRNDFGGGEVMSASKGVKAGMIDDVKDIDTLITELAEQSREKAASHKQKRRAELASEREQQLAALMQEE